MSFRDVLKQYSWDDIKSFIYSRTDDDVKRAIASKKRSDEDFATLLSPAAEKFIEPMAAEAHRITLQRFGKTIKLYAPLYVSNECTNHCTYCGFNHANEVERISLTDEQIRQEANYIAGTGIRHVLLVSGESPKKIGLDYLKRSAEICREIFSAISVEVYPMDTAGYKSLGESGVDGLTIYQETYNRETYATVHPAGKKSDYDWRLDTPERGGAAGLRSIGVGALMGLQDFRVEEFFVGMHAKYLMKNFWKTHVSVSFPRIRHAEGAFKPMAVVQDINLVQSMLSLRLFLNDVGLVISTREPAGFRENLLPLGVTQMSAGSKTDPGGYSTDENSLEQFTVEDSRSVEDFCNVLKKYGYDPVMKDWDRYFLDTV